MRFTLPTKREILGTKSFELVNCKGSARRGILSYKKTLEFLSKLQTSVLLHPKKNFREIAIQLQMSRISPRPL